MGTKEQIYAELKELRARGNAEEIRKYVNANEDRILDALGVIDPQKFRRALEKETVVVMCMPVLEMLMDLRDPGDNAPIDTLCRLLTELADLRRKAAN